MPNTSDHHELTDSRAILLELGARLRRARQDAGLSLRALSARCGMSLAQLSKIETGQAAVTIRHIDVLRTALALPLAQLFQPESGSHYVIMRREAINRDLSRAPASMAMLAGSQVGKHIEPFCFRDIPTPADRALVVHETEVFIFVLHGKLEIAQADDTGVTTDQLERGDALYWCCDVPHTARAHEGDGGVVNYYAVRYQLHGVNNATYEEMGTRRLPGYRVEVVRDVVTESGRKVAHQRQVNGLTMAELAARLGVTVRHLASVESGQRAAEVRLLADLASLFRKPLHYFLGSSGREGPLRAVRRASDPVTYLRTRDRDTFSPLAGGMPNRAMHPFHARLRPATDRPLVQHPGELCAYVLHGELELRTERNGAVVTERLGVGDSLFLDCAFPHDIRGYSQSHLEPASDALFVWWTPNHAEPPLLTRQ